MTDTLTELSSGFLEELKKPIKEVPVVQDQGYFQHTTGDTYDGFFEAKKKDRSVKMHGPGIYTTSEGDTYAGTWDADRLGGSDEVMITFKDGSKYKGLLKDWNYTSQGQYFYPDGSILHSNFSENCPIGNLQLTDPNGHIWLGTAEQGFGWFDPINHFFDMLEKTRESAKKRRQSQATL